MHLAFDVVFNHTTLEHIYDIRKAVANLCAMSRDAVVLVVPFMQASHATDVTADYWRLTAQALRKLLEDSRSKDIEDFVSLCGDRFDHQRASVGFLL